MSARLLRIPNLLSGRMLRLFSASVLDQAVLSAANFIVGFLMIRLTTDNDYGQYVLVVAARDLLVSLQRAGLSGPLTLVAARKEPQERIRSAGAVKDAQRRTMSLLLVAGQLVPLAGGLLGLMPWRTAGLVSLALLAVWASMRRELLRDIMLMFSKTQSLLLADLVFVGVLVATAFAATQMHSATALWATGGIVAASLAGDALVYRMLAAGPGWLRGDAGPVLREVWPLGFWAALGGVTYWFYSSASNYMLAWLAHGDLTAVADVNATRLLIMPVMLLTAGVQSVLNPMAALWYAEVGISRLTRRLIGVTLGLLLLDASYVAIAWLSRDWLTGTLLHKQIGQRDALLLLWAAVVLIGVIRDGMSYALFAAGRLKMLAGQGILCAAVGLTMTWIGWRWWGAAAGLIAQIISELINLAGFSLILREVLRPGEAARAVPPAAAPPG
jgi:O-antigen/teichoic acid export membrane protein